MGVLGSVYQWATSGVRTAPTTAMKASGFEAAVPPGAGVMNHIVGLISDAVKALDDAFTNADMTINISPVAGGWLVMSGTMTVDEANGLVRSSSASALEIGYNLSSLCRFNATSATTWTLKTVNVYITRTDGSMEVDLRERDVTLGVTPTNVTLGTAETADFTDAPARSITAGTETVLKITLNPNSAGTDIVVNGVSVTLTRNGVP